jgi:NADP-dependent 3-hydroxy acid dehydrogenase YdfG
LVLIGQTPPSDDARELAATDEAGLIRLLAGRSPGTPAELAARARRVLAAREVRANLAEFERAGVEVRYVTADVRDAGALGEALATVRREWGPITGIVHGAGVLADARLEEKTDEQFARVFATKVDGLRNLLAAAGRDPLELLCAFSSVAGVFGNAGQADYAMANEVLTRVLADEGRARPGCLVRSIAWGPWAGGMVTATVAERFRGNGTPLIDPVAGARAFVRDLTGAPDPVLAILSPPGDASDRTGLVAEVVATAERYPYVADHTIDGAAIVPVATVLDWFAGAAVAWRPERNGIVLRDLRVLHGIAVPARLELRGHEATAEDGPALDLDLGEGARPCYRATVTEAAPSPSERWCQPSGVEPFEDPYGTLFHGPALRVVRGAPAVGPGGAEGLVGSTAPAAGGFVDVAAVDGALQLALLWAHRAGAGDTLPMAIGEVRLHRHGPVDGEVRCIVRAVHVNDAGAVCDAALLDAGGRALVELIGIHLVRRPRS